ncbi:MAG TPA: DUF3078 domain-containing protein [Chitinophagaceae bacterium]|nr:DUF3078 domain-containing protein [Chitinophagaceae bacterium]
MLVSVWQIVNYFFKGWKVIFAPVNVLLARHMKKPILLFISFVSVSLACYSQDDIPVRQLPTEVFRTITKPVDTVKYTWKRGGVFNLNMAEGSQKNWAAGGDNFSIALTTYINYYLYYQHKNQTWDNNVDFNLGFLQTTSIGARKNDDRLDYLSKYGVRVDTSNKLYISGLFNFRTQFFDGYTYDGAGGRKFSSTFLSPGYVILSAGMDYKPTPELSIFFSLLTDRATILANPTLTKQGLYGVDSGHHFFNEFGGFASINYSHSFGKNVTYKGRMDLFSNYASNPQNIDVYMTHYVTFKINKYLSTTYALNLIYDDDVKLFGPMNNSPALQIQSQIGIGLSVPFTVKRYQE